MLLGEPLESFRKVARMGFVKRNIITTNVRPFLSHEEKHKLKRPFFNMELCDSVTNKLHPAFVLHDIVLICTKCVHYKEVCNSYMTQATSYTILNVKGYVINIAWKHTSF